MNINLLRSVLTGLVFSTLFSSTCAVPPEGAVTKPGWTSLFDGKTLGDWKITQFGGEGLVEVRDGGLYLGMGNSLTGITWTEDFPTNGYEISLEAKRVQGNDFFCGLTFPVNDSHCSLIVGGWGGALVGISSIDGMDASENETSTGKRFDDNVWYRITVRVSGHEVQAWIGDEEVVEIDIEGRELTVRPEVRLSRPLGIATWITAATLRDIRYRRVETE